MTPADAQSRTPKTYTIHPVSLVIEGAVIAALSVGFYALGTLLVARIGLNGMAKAQTRRRQRRLLRLVTHELADDAISRARSRRRS